MIRNGVGSLGDGRFDLEFVRLATDIVLEIDCGKGTKLHFIGLPL